MSQADERMWRPAEGRAVVRVGGPAHQDEWADLRPAFAWAKGKRPVLIAAILLITAQVVWRALFLSRMYFYRDDFFNLDLAKASPLNWHYLTYVGTGHLMIGERLIMWVAARLSLYNWGLASAITLAFLAVAGLALFVVLRTLFGERPAILLPLACYLLSPLGIAGLGWWAVALESLPLQLAACLALNSHVHYVRTGRARHLASALAWLALGMAFFEKGMVVPLLLFGVTSAFLMSGGSWISGIWQAAIRFRRAWLLYAVVVAGYALVLATAMRTSAIHPSVPSSSAVVTFGWGLVKNSLLPGVIGGPWQWLPLPGNWYALAAPPTGLVWLAIIVDIAVLVASVLRRAVAWRAWAIFAGWVIVADIVPVAISRLNWYPVLLALDTRYVADAIPVLVICLGLAFLPVIGRSEATAAQAREAGAAHAAAAARPPASGAEQALRPVAIGLLAVVIGGSLWSVDKYQSTTSGQAAASYVANATLATQLAPRGTLVLDGTVPAELKDSTNVASSVIGPIQPGKLTWIKQLSGTIDGLKIFGSDGRLYRVWVYGASSGHSAVNHGCFPALNGRIMIKFFQRSPYLTTLLRIGYLWGSPIPGSVGVQFGHRVQQLVLRPGLHTAFLTVTGVAASVRITGVSGTALCVGDAEAGFPGPLLAAPALPASPVQ
jgi:hypothetical protein